MNKTSRSFEIGTISGIDILVWKDIVFTKDESGEITCTVRR
jgi:hypothetical protein